MLKRIAAPLLAGVVLTTCWSSPYSIDFTDSHGIQVDTGEFAVDSMEFDRIVDQTIDAWENAFAVERPDAVPRLRHIWDGVIVMWETYPFPCPGIGVPMDLCAGLMENHILHIGWRPDVEDTALGHELGHFILWVLDGDPSEERLLWFHERFATPY